MKNKWLPYVLILLMIAAIVIIKSQNNKQIPTVTNKKPKDPNSKTKTRGFDRRTGLLEYSNHARCRMQCRKISVREVEDIMETGKINYDKSDLDNARCPRYALEGITTDNQRVRIIYAQCNKSTTVVTVIDLQTDFECDCPGDDDKYINRK